MRFPGESERYRAARDELTRAELELRAHGAPSHDVVRSMDMSELFSGDKDTLVLYSFMYGLQEPSACPLFTSLIDALDGEVDHISQLVDFAVVARSPLARLRGQVPMLSVT